MNPDVLPMSMSQFNDLADEERHYMHQACKDLRAFSPLYARYFPLVYGYCLRRLNDMQEAEDMTSLIFARALRSVEAYRGGSVRAWLFTIAHNAIINHYRDRKPRISLDASALEIIDHTHSPTESILSEERAEAIRKIVATLTADDQSLLSLKIDAGLTSEEIGQTLGLSSGAVRVRLHRIIKRLRALYLEELR